MHGNLLSTPYVATALITPTPQSTFSRVFLYAESMVANIGTGTMYLETLQIIQMEVSDMNARCRMLQNVAYSSFM